MTQSSEHQVSSPTLPTTRAWVTVVAVGVVAAAHIWKLPVALPLLEAELGMSLITAGMLVGIIQLASMVGGLFVAWGGELAGLRRLLMLGLLLLAIGSCLGATTVDALHDGFRAIREWISAVHGLGTSTDPAHLPPRSTQHCPVFLGRIPGHRHGDRLRRRRSPSGARQLAGTVGGNGGCHDRAPRTGRTFYRSGSTATRR